MGRNVDISGGNLPCRLKQLREQKHMTQTDLAKRAGLSYRTVLDLERRRRERVQVKTLMLLSDALEVTYEELLGNAVENGDNGTLLEVWLQARPPLWRHPRIVTPAVLILLIVVVGMIVMGNVSAARYELVDDRMKVVARGNWLGVHCWSREFGARIRVCETSPWSEDVVLIGLYGDTVGGGRLVALDRETGETLWEVAPDVDAIARAFGEDVAFSANYSCTGLASPDLDGDGTPDLVARFCHGLWYPNALCFIDSEGRLTSQYSHKGHIYVMQAEDIDEDGKDELIVAGTNNTQAYQGATVFVLDETHRSGASVDAKAAPDSAEPDSALYRVVLPQFPEPYMRYVGAVRLETNQIKTSVNAQGDFRLTVTVSSAGQGILIVEMDNELHPLSCGVADAFLGSTDLNQWPDSLIVDTGPGDEAWRTAWVDGHVRFEAGHWPPALANLPVTER